MLPKQSNQGEKMFSSATDLIYHEFDKAVAKFPEWPDEPSDGYMVLAEEVGEIAKALVDYRWGRTGIDDAIEEAAQSGAMCIRLLQRLLLIKKGESGEKVTDTTGAEKE